MAIRNVLLKKKIGSTLYDIYVKTDAALVDYTRGSGENAVNTNVAAELAKIASDATTAVNSLRTEIMGTGTINEYFDTVKEIADWLQDTHNTTAATIVTDLNNVIDDVGVARIAHDAVGGDLRLQLRIGDGDVAGGLGVLPGGRVGCGLHQILDQIFSDRTVFELADASSRFDAVNGVHTFPPYSYHIL